MELTDAARGRAVIERWCILAEQRLDYLAELYECGRWRRYFGEAAFLQNIQDAKAAVETWRELLDPEQTETHDPAWLGRNKSLLPRGVSRPASRSAAESRLRELRPTFRFAEPVPMPGAGAVSLTPPDLHPMRASPPAEPPAQPRLAIVAVNEPAAVAEAEPPGPQQPPPWQHALDEVLLGERYSLLRKAG